MKYKIVAVMMSLVMMLGIGVFQAGAASAHPGHPAHDVVSTGRAIPKGCEVRIRGGNTGGEAVMVVTSVCDPTYRYKPGTLMFRGLEKCALATIHICPRWIRWPSHGTRQVYDGTQFDIRSVKLKPMVGLFQYRLAVQASFQHLDAPNVKSVYGADKRGFRTQHFLGRPWVNEKIKGY